MAGFYCLLKKNGLQTVLLPQPAFHFTVCEGKTDVQTVQPAQPYLTFTVCRRKSGLQTVLLPQPGFHFTVCKEKLDAQTVQPSQPNLTFTVCNQNILQPRDGRKPSDYTKQPPNHEEHIRLCQPKRCFGRMQSHKILVATARPVKKIEFFQLRRRFGRLQSHKNPCCNRPTGEKNSINSDE